MSDAQTQEFMVFATDVIKSAGEIACKYFRTPLKVDVKGNGSRFDPVTAADREIEAFIRERISSRYPDHAILGEEAGAHKGSSTYRWVIDPIDGTRSFISGSPMWGILLGLMEGETCLLGLMHQPYIKETFTGSSAGAFIDVGADRRPIATRSVRTLDEATVYSTHPSMFNSEQDYARFLRVADRCRLMRYGGDCYSYCLLASGFIDLVIEGGLAPYDIIPLIPIIEGAGGVVTNWSGGPAVSGGNIIAAATSELHELAVSFLS
jgi:histidinol phosphatase-like enzyme (inositol monophosphatase family)